MFKIKNSARIALAASVLWLAFLTLGRYKYFGFHDLSRSDWEYVLPFGLIVIWVLKFILGTFVDKKGEDDPIDEIMLARLLLVIHWGIYAAVIGGVGSIIIDIEASSAVWGPDEWFAFLFGAVICIAALALFTIIYWIVKGRWIFFPWEHVEND